MMTHQAEFVNLVMSAIIGMGPKGVHVPGLCAPQPSPALSNGPRFWIVPSAATTALLARPVAWGARLTELDPKRAKRVRLEAWQLTHHTEFQAPVFQQLRLHRACTNSSVEASVCVIASPPKGSCEDWGSICAGRPLVAIEQFGNVDLRQHWRGTQICRTLWDCHTAPRLRRVVVQRPLFVNRWPGCGTNPTQTIEIPYVCHARRFQPSRHPLVSTPSPACVLTTNTSGALSRLRGLLRGFDDLCCGVASALSVMASELGEGFDRLIAIILAVEDGQWSNAASAGVQHSIVQR